MRHAIILRRKLLKLEMDLKPIVTNFGEEVLYQDLSKDVERRLPSESVTWQRTHGRESKTVNIKATFTKFNSDQLGVVTDGTVTKQPFLHLYWTSCLEHDEFRNGVKQKILNWQENLKSRDIGDWLIIQVVYQDRPNASRNKIVLPRSSVFDKIKNDLCGKNGARVVQFLDPKKENLFTKSRDSWVTLLSRLRQLLLESISKHLTKFEEKVRCHREKYSDPNWSFVEHLKLNEELATIFKSVTLHKDALVQYDQMDALFSQFVVNGQIKGIPPWMKQFTEAPTTWDGISLRKQAVKYFRDAVYEGRASLIDLRNYIFIRQWQMLVNIHKNWDVAHRLLEFLFTVVIEMKMLLTGLSSSVPACWVISCCLEYMHSVENKEFSNRSVMASLAQVLDYAREKLFLLGTECRLLPGQEPAEELIDKITTGLCKSQPIKDGNEVGTRSLFNALKSQANFDKLYLRTCGRTKSLFSSVGRYRFANRVGIDMAKYYMMKRKYGNAEAQLLTALSDYKQSNWTNLYIDVLEPLATCQSGVEPFDNYLRSLAALACTKELTVEKRLEYAERFLQSTREWAKNEAEKAYTVAAEPVISLEGVKIDLIKEIGHVGETIDVALTVRNNLLKEIFIDEIEVRIQYTETDKVRLSSSDGGRNSLQRPADRTNWSELFEEKEPTSPSVTKSGLLQRIKSRRSIKQKDTGNRDETDHSPVTTNPGADLGNKGTFTNRFFSSDLPLSSDKPKTLAEIARALPRTLSLSDDSEEGKSEKSSTPIAIPNGLIHIRCESAASSLSVVSMSSSADANSLNDLGQEPKGERPKIMSSLALNENSNLNIEPEDYVISDSTNKSVFICEESDPKYNGGDEGHTSQVDGASPYEDCDAQEDNEFVEREFGGIDEDRVSAKFDLGSDKLEEENEEVFGDDDGSEKMPRLSSNCLDDSLDDEIGEFSDIEEEVEIQPTKSLLSGPTLLSPGENVVIVKAKVMHIGRYTLQTLRCRIGSVFLYNLLGLSRQSRAFFIVSDPPKFSWTSTHIAECLLLGSKQRIHVTLFNGPGFICESSVIQMSSSTGLEFSPVAPSSVMVYSTNKKEEPREGAMHIELSGTKRNEAYMYLPKCGPYEKADLYFDAYAPVENVDLFEHMMKHEVSLHCLWLPEMARDEAKLESLFYEPFTIEHEKLVSTNGNYLSTTLISLNPVQIKIIKPELKCLNSEKFSFTCLSCDVPMSVQASEELALIWRVEEVESEKRSPQVLICRLKVNFKTEDDEDVGEFSKQFEVTSITQQLLTVDTAIDAGEDPSSIYKGSSYNFKVTVKTISQGLPRLFEHGQIICTLVDNDQWKYDDDIKSRKQEISSANEYLNFTFTTKVIPCLSGILRHPAVAFSATVPASADVSPEETCQAKKHHVTSGLTNRLSSSRRTSADTSSKVTQPFAAGEVIFTCAGKCIQVLQPKRQVSVL